MDTTNQKASPLLESESHQRLRKLSTAFAALQAAGLACFVSKDFDGFRTTLDIEREIIAEQERILDDVRREHAPAGQLEPRP